MAEVPKKNGLQTMRGMKPREALDYFFTYYSVHLIIVVTALLFVILLIRGSVTADRREVLISGLLIDPGFTEEMANRGEDAYGEYRELAPETQRVQMDFAAAADIGGTVSVEGMQKVLTAVVAREVDVLLGNAAETDYLLKSGALSDLNAILEEETLEKYAGSLWYVDTAAMAEWGEIHQSGDLEYNPMLVFPSPEGMTEPVPVAVNVSAGCERVFGRLGPTGTVLLSVSVTTEAQEEIGRFLDWLYN